MLICKRRSTTGGDYETNCNKRPDDYVITSYWRNAFLTTNNPLCPSCSLSILIILNSTGGKLGSRFCDLPSLRKNEQVNNLSNDLFFEKRETVESEILKLCENSDI